MVVKRLLKGGLVLGVTAVALVVGSPAWAIATIPINPGNVPTTAAGFGTHECNANQGGGPFAGQDVWVFVLPGNHATSGDFVSITAQFAGHPDVTITAAANPGNFSNGGPATSKGWIITPAGWTLTGGSAVITGTQEFFNLTATCPASGTTPSTTPTSTPSGAPPTGGGGTSGDRGSVWGVLAVVAATGSGIALMLARRRRDAS
jgi:hypothetical protein